MLIRSLKEAIDHGLMLQEAHRVIGFYQKVW